jgi:DNA-binding CsgD family transcriptional regulator
MLTTLPDAWAAHYREMGYWEIDPFFAYCCSTFSAFGTGVDYSQDYDYLTDAQRRLINEASEFGIRAGFSSTMRKREGSDLAGWNIGSSMSRAEVEAVRIEQGPVLRLVAMYAHERLRDAPGDEAPVLSPRERECLTWLMQGERTKDIAQRLGLSAVAVDLYVRNARRKLGARTREQAVAKAILLGVLKP